jgi:hypothetical protein
MIAGEEINMPPVTFRPEGRMHMITGEIVWCRMEYIHMLKEVGHQDWVVLPNRPFFR